MRGFVFTLMALLIGSVLVLFAVTDQPPALSSKTAVPEVREMNGLVQDIESDVDRGLYITGFRALLGQIEYLVTQGEFLNDTDASFVEAMTNGTVQNESLSALNGTTFSVWLEQTEGILEERGFTFDYEIVSLSQGHYNASMVQANATITYNLTDSRDQRSFTRTVASSALIPIEGLEDPTYFVKSLGRISNTIEFTNETDLDTLINWSANESRYRFSDKSPSLLMRLENDFSASPHGIESIVNGERFINQGVGTYDGRSSIDALYFSTISHDPRCMSGTPSWFRLDVGRFSDYTGATNVSC